MFAGFSLFASPYKNNYNITFAIKEVANNINKVENWIEVGGLKVPFFKFFGETVVVVLAEMAFVELVV